MGFFSPNDCRSIYEHGNDDECGLDMVLKKIKIKIKEKKQTEISILLDFVSETYIPRNRNSFVLNRGGVLLAYRLIKKDCHVIS